MDLNRQCVDFTCLFSNSTTRPLNYLTRSVIRFSSGYFSSARRTNSLRIGLSTITLSSRIPQYNFLNKSYTYATAKSSKVFLLNLSYFTSQVLRKQCDTTKKGLANTG